MARFMPVIVLALAFAAAPLAQARGRLEKDECSRRSAECERRCARGGERDQLSCKTECRLEEARCRSGKR